jgi:hypothetical protein
MTPAFNDSKDSKDFLGRDSFIRALQNHIHGLAAIELELLPAPRVLAVDAPWGYGKSWVATKLFERLVAGDEGAAVLIDAFRFDHHDDAFAVIASSAMKALKPNAERKRNFLRAAGRVLKTAAPAAVKGVSEIALRTVGVESKTLSEVGEKLKDFVIDGAADYSEKSIEAMLERYSETQRYQDDFVEAFSAITKNLPKPFVVIIDELDRCRPSFALEVLERIKHLFSAENVVFVLFWSSAAIQESVRHTYGGGIRAQAYLSKFIALSVPLPAPVSEAEQDQNPYWSFISRELSRTNSSLTVETRDKAASALAAFAQALNVSLRDAQKAIRLFNMAGIRAHAVVPEFAYLALVKVTDDHQFTRLSKLDSNAAGEELKRLPGVDDEDSSFTESEKMVLLLTYLCDPRGYEEIAARGHHGDNLRDDNVISSVGVGQRRNRVDDFQRAAKLIEKVLAKSQAM